MHRFRVLTLLAAVAVLAVSLLPAELAAAPVGEIVTVEYHPGGLVFRNLIGHGGMTLTVTGPRKFATTETFDPDKGGILDTREFKDGYYRWEVLARPDISREIEEAIARARLEGDMEFVCQLQDEGILPLEPLMQSGSFQVDRGRVLDPTVQEPGDKVSGDQVSRQEDADEIASGEAVASAGQPVAGSGIVSQGEADQVILDDLIVDGSLCVGFDCVNGEVFSFDTIRLKENNLRIKFEDTSVGAFPSRDWQLTANDSANGGLSKFSIDDITGGRTPFTIEANAPSHSLYVDDAGRIGRRTSTPAVELHLVDGDTPTLRLQQDSSSGFAAQTWDVAGNETNFFVRDVTNGSTLPFKIRPSAPSNSLVIADDGDVAVGLATPDADVRFHVQANSNVNFGGVRVENSGTGNIQTQFANTNLDFEWRQNFRNAQLDFNFGPVGSVNTVFTIENDGDVIATSFTPTSDRNLKQGFAAVDTGDVLERLSRVPVMRWSFIHDNDQTPHIGPVAQDFHAAFGVGADDKHIATTDADGVAFAAIQALYQRLQQQENDFRQLLAEKDAALADLQKRLEALESTP